MNDDGAEVASGIWPEWVGPGGTGITSANAEHEVIPGEGNTFWGYAELWHGVGEGKVTLAYEYAIFSAD